MALDRMSSPDPHRLSLNADPRQQRFEWRLQRIVWPLLALLLVAVAAGLLGQGPAARASGGSEAAGLTMRYQRFLRRGSPEALELRLRAASDEVRLQVAARYLESVAWSEVFPAPLRVTADDEAATLVFHARPGQWTVVRVQLQPRGVGTAQGWLAVDGGPRQPIGHFVYP
ncbi:hypothetical protein IS481_12890 [Caldimonas thermodepolymerans]|jgi:hypothetical protein|uniref:Uncharacterized protein n=1 Tax=Caldimonas thermodepolymerans TaxID=215580 RepID=A0A2S5T9S9_9BURK|nr:hypothetical protein [Caldimonas thermodepolymerans]PPE71627.1 hypothetical protein C1702_01115 [Caldimonas thermodepolymerans]QPC30651.1 hypothetical protein IS481_12890 [Caldimonas thermodepolymerans]RDI02741.1 hypothetical protein DES46_102168 [Caldimonas thermodepolymerans]UZG43388.1 hypothetical protein ONZ46_13390 [Caldimonas thermodepolymerans]